MSLSSKWHKISHEQDDLPMLILKADFDQDGYSVYLSDLNSIWSEQLNHGHVCERADTLRCSIDPEESRHQYDILSQHLHDALLQRDGCSMQIKSENDQVLLLSVNKALPKPLSPLYWEVHLRRSALPLLRSQLVDPLLHEVSELRRQKTLLFSEIAAKDHVISRMADRLEASGTPLSEIFPNAANLPGARRHGTSREKLAQHVRGLGVFAVDVWSAQVHQSSAAGLDDSTMAEVLKDLPDAVKSGRRSTDQQWWKDAHFELSANTNGNSAVAGRHQSSNRAEAVNTPDDRADTVSTPDDNADAEKSAVDFQRQETPKRAGGDITTDDELDVGNPAEAAAQHTAHPATRNERGKPASVNPSRATKKRLGTIGGRAQPRAHENDEPTSSQQTSEPPAPTAAAAAAAAPPQRLKLGTIGGKAKPKPAPAQDATEEQIDNSQSSKTLSEVSSARVRSRTPFTIGGKKERASSKRRSQSPSTEHKDHTVHRGEVISTSETAQASSAKEADLPDDVRADNKREELKRQLEQKKQAPVKKKRRF